MPDEAARLDIDKRAKQANGGVATALRALLDALPLAVRKMVSSSSASADAQTAVLQLDGSKFAVRIDDTDDCLFSVVRRGGGDATQLRARSRTVMMHWVNAFEDLGVETEL